MALGLNTNGNGADFIPIVKWDARAGRLFRVDRTQGANGWESSDTDLTFDKPAFLVDFGSIQVGFLAFLSTGPSFTLVPLGSPLPEKPSADHRPGMRVKLYSPKHFDGVREFASSAKAVLSAMDALHTAFEAAPEAAQGKLPIVQLDGSTQVVTKGPNGNVTSYSPAFKIVRWADRPSDLGERTVPPPGTKAAPAKPANHVPPPAPKKPAPTPEPAMADDEMPF